MGGIAAVLYGVMSYVLFLGTILYAIAFVGGLPVPTTIGKSEFWMNFARRTGPSVTSRLLPPRHGSMPAFCCAARGVPTGKWISSATFAIC